VSLADPKVLKVLLEAVRRARHLNAATRRTLREALRRTEGRWSHIVDALRTYRDQFARVLTASRLAALLLGMGSLLDQLPQRPAPANPFTTESQTRAEGQFPQVRAMQPALRELYLQALPPEEALYLRGRLEEEPPPPQPPWQTAAPPGGEEIRFPVIEEAVKSLRERGVLTKPVYDLLDTEARQRAWTVAGVEEQFALTKIHKALLKAVGEGESLTDFTRRVGESVDVALSDTRLEQVFRDGVQASYSRGLDRILAHPLVGSYFPYQETVPILDSRCSEMCKLCAASGIQGTGIYRSDDPTWERIKPPRHHLCRCARICYTLQRAAEKGIREAVEWFATGRPPAQPAWMPMPPIQLSPDYVR
jgi:hypothetical protein